MYRRHIAAGGGASALAGTRRVALGPGWSGVGWGGVGEGGHWRNRCLCGKNRKTRKCDGVIFFSSLCHARVLFLFFYPSPLTRGVNLFITRPKKNMKLKLTRCLFICAFLLCFLPPCAAHPGAVSPFPSMGCLY